MPQQAPMHYPDEPSMQQEFEAGFQKGILDERQRYHAIIEFGSSPSVNRFDLAKHLAMTTNMTVAEAKTILVMGAEGASKTKAQVSNIFADAMAALGNPDIRAEIDGGDEGDSARAIASRIAGMKPASGN